MIAVGKHLVLVGQVGAAGIDQVDAGQIVLQRDLLRAQMLLHRQRIVGAALHRGVVDHHHHLGAFDATDAGDHPGRGDVAAIEAPGGELADLEEGRAGIEQLRQPLPGQQLAARRVPPARLLRAAALDMRGLFPDVGHQPAQPCRIGLEAFGGGRELGMERRHFSSWSDAHGLPRPGREAVMVGDESNALASYSFGSPGLARCCHPFSADHLDLAVQVQRGPYPVGGDRCCFLAYGQRQTGPIAQREHAFWRATPQQTGRNRELMVEVDNGQIAGFDVRRLRPLRKNGTRRIS